MLLESIELTNFRQYLGTQSAAFAIESGRNVTVFHGLNGAGKTSLFVALNWCLYGAAADGIGELINKEELTRTPLGNTAAASVKVSFRDDDKRYIAMRSITGRRTGTGVEAAAITFTLVRFLSSGNSETVTNPLPVMNSILAANVRPYFFFDGERMEDLTKAGNDEVREAVRNVMRLPMLERAEEHLNYVASEFRREIKKHGSGELERLVTLEDSYRAQKQDCLKRKDEIKNEITIARQRLEDLTQNLRENEGARALQQQRDEIARQRASWEKQERETSVMLQRLLNSAYLRFVSSSAGIALAILDEKRERGEIPSGVREQVIMDLLQAHKCLCGRPFCDGDDAFTHLQARLNTTAKKQIEREASDLSAGIRALYTIGTDRKTALEDCSRRRHEIKNEIERLVEQDSEAEHELRGSEKTDVAALERLRAEFQQKLERNIAAQAENNSRIDGYDRNIEDVLRQKAVAEAKEQKLQLISKSELLSQNAADAVTRLREEFFEETRKTVEGATKEVFARLAWKQEHFQDVQIDDGFRIEVIDRWGTPTRKELSAGERQILSLSFICAMASMSGEEAPLVMDTPFGRLSGNHLAAVAENLPGLAKQLILFVTDREWDEASRTSLEPRTGCQYNLDFDTATGCTSIVEVKV